MSAATFSNEKQNYANGNPIKGCFFISPNEDPFGLPIDSRIKIYPMLKKYFPRGFETYQIFMDDSQLEYICIFFDADNRGMYNSSYAADIIASTIGISPTGNMLILRKKWINKEECLVDMDMRFDEFFWRGIVGKNIRKSAYFLPPCCWDREFIRKKCDEFGEVNISSCDDTLLSLGNTREELKAKNDKKRKAKKAKKIAERKTRICSICATPTRNICNGCKLIYYCSTECQSSDWKKHKKICPCN